MTDTGKAVVRHIVGRLTGQQPQDNLPVPQPTKALTPEQRKFFARVVELYGAVSPTKRRKLSAPERETLAQERQALTKAKSAIEKRITAIKTIAQIDMDIRAEESGQAKKAQRDASGHYLLPGEVGGEEGPKIVRTLIEGKEDINPQVLADLVKRGVIDSEDANKMIVTTKEWIEHHEVNYAMVDKWFEKNPDKLHQIAPALEVKPPSIRVEVK